MGVCFKNNEVNKTISLASLRDYGYIVDFKASIGKGKKLKMEVLGTNLIWWDWAFKSGVH